MIFGDGVTIVAELGPNHNGQFQNALRLIESAKDAGADFCKLQAYLPSELVALRGDGPAPEPWGSQGWTMRDLYESAATPFEWFPELVAHAKDIGIGWFASVFGAESLAMLEGLDCPAYKIAAMEWSDSGLRHMVEATGKPVVRSMPLAQSDDGGPWNVYCPPGYPQTELHLARIRSGFYWGFSYHGQDPNVPAYAVVAGARYIETHIHLEDEPSRLEAGFAFTGRGFKEMVHGIRKAEALL